MPETVKDESKKSHKVPKHSRRTNKTLNKINREQINWSPLGVSSSNFATHKLVKVSPERLEVKNVTAYILLSLIAILVGSFWIFEAYPKLSALGGIPFIALAFWPLYKPKAIFDKNTGQFWFGWNKLLHSSNYAKHRLSKVAAVQVAEEYISSNDGAHSYCYELNLVMENGKRHNVMRHGGKKMHEDGQKLAQFLDVPYFD